MGSNLEGNSPIERRKRNHSPSVSPDWESRPIKTEKMSPGHREKGKKESRHKYVKKWRDEYSSDRRRENRSGKNPDHKTHKHDAENSETHRRKKRPGDYRRSPKERRDDDSRQNFDPSRVKEEFGKAVKEVKDKEKPNFGLSGKLAEDTNVYNGVVIKYNEPSEARKPKRRWRLYPFKAGEPLPFIPIHRQSAYLLGRSRLVADIPIDHPSCSKQHAALQFRLVDYEREDGTFGKRVRPYVIDLDSANGTFVNNKQLEPRRYVELLEKDVIKFGFSSREYVLLHEDSKGEEEDDNVVET